MPDPAQTNAAIEALKAKQAVLPTAYDPEQAEFDRLRIQEALSRDMVRRHLLMAEDPNSSWIARLAHRATAALYKPVNKADKVFAEDQRKHMEETPVEEVSPPEVYGPPEPYGPPAPPPSDAVFTKE